MGDGEKVVIVGASARAAAFSALRAGLKPWCADLFRDADLARGCPGMALSPSQYRRELPALLRDVPKGPWMYTGALENRPKVIERITRDRLLWGNGASALRAVRSPARLERICRDAGVSFPATQAQEPSADSKRRWLIKPRASAGGHGIAIFPGRRPREPVWYQEFVEGEPHAALYLGGTANSQLLGVTRQLIGQPWSRAAPFHYCGSVGPIVIDVKLHSKLIRLGDALVQRAGLRGLFGVDFILHDGDPWPIEVNPRYCASLELLEYAGGWSAVALHRAAFENSALPFVGKATTARDCLLGKAILFAAEILAFPEKGPWREVLDAAWPVDVLPPMADIPCAGQVIARGMPILTVFHRADSIAACIESLHDTIESLQRFLPRSC